MICLDPAACQKFLPGHRMHPIHWNLASSSAQATAEVVELGDHTVVLRTAAGELLGWWHHDMQRLASALEEADEVRVVPEVHALRADSHWFNCAFSTAC